MIETLGTHLRVLDENYPMNTNMKGLRWFSKIFVSLFLVVVFVGNILYLVRPSLAASGMNVLTEHQKHALIL